MSRDLEGQLAEYGAQVRSDLPVLDSDEVMFRGESFVVVGGDGHRPTVTRPSAVVVAAAFVAVLAFGLFQMFTSSPPEVADTVAPPSDLGVFEPIRGWIVYPTGGDLEAVNPDNPSERANLDLPLEFGFSVPVGWSADGALLALRNEDVGSWSVMDSSGAIRFDGSSGGCCLFVGSNWLSPDGASTIGGAAGALDIGAPETLNVVALNGGGTRHLLDMDQLEGIFGLRGGVWSPDGSQVAFAAEREGGMTILLVEVETGAFRELDDSTLGYVRHLAWSPDGSQLLVTSADLYVGERENYPRVNPLVNPLSARLYLVDVYGSGRREIASGHYVATAWSPDGTRIAALDYNSSGRRVVLMNADGGQLEELPDVVPSGPFTGVAWHPAP